MGITQLVLLLVLQGTAQIAVVIYNLAINEFFSSVIHSVVSYSAQMEILLELV